MEAVQSDTSESSVAELERSIEKLPQTSQTKKKKKEKELSVISKHLTFRGNSQEIHHGNCKTELTEERHSKKYKDFCFQPTQNNRGQICLPF